MKVLFVNYEFPPLGGGGGTTTKFIARSMAANNVEVRVLTSGFKGLPATEHQDGYTVIRVPSLRLHESDCSPFEMICFMISAVWPMLRIIREWKPDCAHVFFALPTGPLGLFAKKIAGLPYVLYLLGGDVPGFLPNETGWQHRALKALSHAVWKNASFTVANSDGLLGLARRAFPDVPLRVITNGVDTAAFCPMDMVENCSGRDPSGLHLLFVGRFAPQKGLLVLLQAIDRLCSTGNSGSIKLTIVGDGPEKMEYEAFVATRGLQKHLRFLGWVPLQKLCGIYNQADIFILPSIAEGMPSVVLQALSCGRPVISTKVYGSENLIIDGYNGYIVSPNDPVSLAECIRRFMGNRELLETMKRNARESVVSYDWTHKAAEFMELYRQMVQKK
jgi:glycogen(starch) synthase